MANITLGTAYGTWFPPGVSLQLALNYCCSGSPQAAHYNPNSYKKEFNLTFSGSAYPMIRITSRSIPGAWAAMDYRGWGVGTLIISTGANEKKWWVSNWPDVEVRQRVFDNLMFHEFGHCLLYTRSQDISCPLNATMRARGIAHWGKSPYRTGFELGAHYLDEPEIVRARGMVFDRARGLFAQRHVVDNDLMEDIAKNSLGE